jgi:hypothetical protein
MSAFPPAPDVSLRRSESTLWVIFDRVNGDGLLVEVRFTPKAPKPASAALSFFGIVGVVALLR